MLVTKKDMWAVQASIPAAKSFNVWSVQRAVYWHIPSCKRCCVSEMNRVLNRIELIQRTRESRCSRAVIMPRVRRNFTGYPLQGPSGDARDDARGLQEWTSSSCIKYKYDSQSCLGMKRTNKKLVELTTEGNQGLRNCPPVSQKT